MPYLLDTNAISEVFKRRPNPDFAAWLDALPRVDQFTSIVVIGELYVVAFRSRARGKWLHRIHHEILSRMTVLPFDLSCAQQYGRIRAQLADAGTPLERNDVQIAATAVDYGLTLVTANIRHFSKVEGLKLEAFTTGQTRPGSS